MEEVTIVHNQIDAAIHIMNEVADWARKQGYQVWPPEKLTKEALVNEDAKEEDFCVGRINGQDACCFILQWKDKEWWTKAPEYEAAYLHKFCVRRAFAHQHMTKKVVEAIKLECRKRDIKYIRLDTGWDKERVKQIYLAAGFQIVKKQICDNGKAMALYEMRVE